MTTSTTARTIGSIPATLVIYEEGGEIYHAQDMEAGESIPCHWDVCARIDFKSDGTPNEEAVRASLAVLYGDSLFDDDSLF